MKLLTFTVPCYNSEAYMEKCIRSLLTGGEDVEIIIVYDGSRDGTAAIADRFAAEYPTIIKAVHQDNGGHGEAVNAGLRNATGLHFKVVDSDDWVNQEAYEKVLSTLKRLLHEQQVIDMMICNYVYEKQGALRKKVMRYKTAFPREEVFGWNNVKFLHKGQYILMHSVIYRTKMLYDCGLELPKHTFYVDNIFVFDPLPYVKQMYYLDVNFYRYFIGREDQSVNEQVMIGRIDQQIRVTKILIDKMVSYMSRPMNAKLKKYMINYVDIMMTVSSVLLLKSGTPENLEKKKELWEYLRKASPKLYRKIKLGILGRTMNLPGRSGRKISVAAYKVAQKLIGFN